MQKAVEKRRHTRPQISVKEKIFGRNGNPTSIRAQHQQWEQIKQHLQQQQEKEDGYPREQHTNSQNRQQKRKWHNTNPKNVSQTNHRPQTATQPERRRKAQRRSKRARRKAEESEEKVEYELTRAPIDRAVAAANLQCYQDYGFAANDTLSSWTNILNTLANTPAITYFSRPTNRTYHNLCTTITPPPNIANLLGLGDKFCIERRRPNQDQLQTTIERLKRSIRIRWFLILNPPDPNRGGYIPGLYINSSWEPPPVEVGNVELRMMEFSNQLQALAGVKYHQRPRTNLSSLQLRLMKTIRNEPLLICCLADKNLGPVIMERAIYYQKVHKDHLDKPETYQRLTRAEALIHMASTSRDLKDAYLRGCNQLPEAVQTYFDRALEKQLYDYRTPRFYITIKVQKTPWATRPVVSCCGSFNEVFSKWLDYQMKQLVQRLSQTYLKDSFAVLTDLKELGTLPQNARLFTADAVSMYTNIDTEHALETFKRWFETFPDDVPRAFPTGMFLEVLGIVMRNNVFQFDDTYWHQLTGTAMGTSTACMYATLYYAFHERLTLLPSFPSQILYYRRFIDDIIGIWYDYNDQTGWDAFKNKLPYGSLTWETSKLDLQTVFLDLTISIDPLTQRLTTKTYQKPMNLFLYIPPHSAHPLGVLKSLIYGNLRRYWLQNTNTEDYIDTANRFRDHLVNRGHPRSHINELFIEASQRIDSPNPQRVQPDDDATDSPLFIHWEYHPRGVTRQELRQLYTDTLHGYSGFERMIVAFSRPRNLRDKLMPTTIEAPPGPTQASTLFPI